jgi:hypothetical protein
MTKKSIPRALHIKNGDNHLIALGNINVLVSESGDGCFAQAVEVDYFACGVSLEDVQARFTQGLIATVEEHLRRYNTIERFLKWAPDEVRADIQDRRNSEQYRYTVIDICNIERPAPFQIKYIKEEYKPRAA